MQVRTDRCDEDEVFIQALLFKWILGFVIHNM